MKDRTKLTPDDICSLLKFVLTTTYFRFRGEIYKQVFGCAMGSPVSPVVANLYMEHLETIIMQSSPLDLKPLLWKRYVDDILTIIKVDKVAEFNIFLNTADTTGSIKFTNEIEEDCSIPFLDILIHRNSESGAITTSVFRKKTHTDQYLNFSSHHPCHQKLGVVRTLFDRKDSLVTKVDELEKEDQHIRSALKNCNYPEWSFKRVLLAKQKVNKSEKNRDSTREKSRGHVTLPYIQGVSEKMSRIMKSHGISCSHKPFQKLRDLLVHPKDKLKPLEQSGVIYKVPCKQCDSVYVGETGRVLSVRIKEHESEVSKVSNSRRFTRLSSSQATQEHWKSALTDHVMVHNHIINFEDVKVLDKASEKNLRLIKEAVYIRAHNNTVNRDQGGHYLSHAYDDLIKV